MAVSYCIYGEALHLSPHENILTVALINIHYLYIYKLQTITNNDAISRVNITEDNKTIYFHEHNQHPLTIKSWTRLQHLMHRIAILTKNNNCVEGDDAHAFHFIDQRF